MPEKLTGTVEIDEMYIGSNPRYNIFRKKRRGTATVVGVFERGGKILVRVAPNVQQPTPLGMIRRPVEKPTVYTDEFRPHGKVK